MRKTALILFAFLSFFFANAQISHRAARERRFDGFLFHKGLLFHRSVIRGMMAPRCRTTPFPAS